MDDLRQLVERAKHAASGNGREDLCPRLDTATQRLDEPGVRVLVVGEFKQGKSLLVNALINAPVCPVDDDVATAVPTTVRFGDESATLVFTRVGASTADAALDGSPLERRVVPIDDLERYVTEQRGSRDHGRRLVGAEVSLRRRILEHGLVIVDTPGVGGIGSAHAAMTIAELPLADAVLLVSDAAQEYSEPEIDFLRQAVKLCPNVACVLTKTDIYPRWQQIAELDKVHLAGAGIIAELMPVSSTLRIQAVAADDREMNRESGFPGLVRYVQEGILGRAEVLAKRSVALDVAYAAEHLSLSLQGELSVLRDPAHNQEVIAGLEAARLRSDALKRQSARWQTTLNDGVVDLQADIEYDMRDRTRGIIREAEEILDAADPSLIATQFDEWFQQRVAESVADNFVWAHERSQWLAAQVAEHFAEAGGAALPDLRVADTTGVLDPVRPMPPIEQDHISFGGKILIGMRGSYGGVLMFGLLTGIAGMALVNPLSIGAGVVLGQRAYKEDKMNRIKRRQFDTKVVVRRQIDEVILHVAKQARDRLRQVQRLLRDHFIDVADDMQRSLTESIAAAQRASQLAVEDRDRRIRELDHAVAQVDAITQQSSQLSMQGNTVLT